MRSRTGSGVNVRVFNCSRVFPRQATMSASSAMNAGITRSTPAVRDHHRRQTSLAAIMDTKVPVDIGSFFGTGRVRPALPPDLAQLGLEPQPVLVRPAR
jgi:hypothetical protein